MALITDVAFTWSSPVTLSSDEIWQARAGKVFVTTSANPATNDGLELLDRHAVRLTAGAQIRYRKEGTGTVLIAREAV